MYVSFSRWILVDHSLKLQDVVCAPRPSAPPVRRITATEDEKENALEYGLPSSHTLNTVCLSGYTSYFCSAASFSDGISIK